LCHLTHGGAENARQLRQHGVAYTLHRHTAKGGKREQQNGSLRCRRQCVVSGVRCG
jgi:hypothetical protein